MKYRIQRILYGDVVKYYIERKNLYRDQWYPLTMTLGNLEFHDDDVYVYLLFNSVKEAKEFVVDKESVKVETVEEFEV